MRGCAHTSRVRPQSRTRYILATAGALDTRTRELVADMLAPAHGYGVVSPPPPLVATSAAANAAAAVTARFGGNGGDGGNGGNGGGLGSVGGGGLGLGGLGAMAPSILRRSCSLGPRATTGGGGGGVGVGGMVMAAGRFGGVGGGGGGRRDLGICRRWGRRCSGRGGGRVARGVMAELAALDLEC